MPDILHRVGISSPLDDVYQALATREGLAQWWTDDTRGDDTVGGVLEFHFVPRGRFDMKVLTLEPAKHVRWEVIDGPTEWVGTTIDFDLKREGDQSIVMFKHENWKEPVEFMHHCSTKWGVFLMSLKSLVESGAGAPYPRDTKIDNIN